MAGSHVIEFSFLRHVQSLESTLWARCFQTSSPLAFIENRQRFVLLCERSLQSCVTPCIPTPSHPPSPSQNQLFLSTCACIHFFSFCNFSVQIFSKAPRVLQAQSQKLDSSCSTSLRTIFFFNIHIPFRWWSQGQGSSDECQWWWWWTRPQNVLLPS